MSKFLESKGFKTRLMVCVGLVAVMTPSYLLFDGIIFKVLLGVGFVIAILEMASIGVNTSGKDLSLASFLGVTLIVAAMSLTSISTKLLGTAVMASVATDVGAYLIGNLVGTHHLPKKISPNKTYEGCLGGVLFGMIVTMLWARSVSFIWMAPVAFVGDLLESVFKRRFGVKDSNDFLLKTKNPLVRFVEGLFGGRSGHGGYFDRLDSLSLVLFVQAILTLFFP